MCRGHSLVLSSYQVLTHIKVRAVFFVRVMFCSACCFVARVFLPSEPFLSDALEHAEPRKKPVGAFFFAPCLARPDLEDAARKSAVLDRNTR